ncbi:MAG: MBL fold metallo-hydrolase [Treponema sp.]
MKAQKLFDSVYFIPGSTNIGIILDYPARKTELCDVYIVDSGRGKDDADIILRELSELFPDENYILKAVINTHSHADHSGGNAYLQEKAGCKIWCSEGEAAGLQNPLIQSSVEWGGNPIEELKTEFYLPKKCKTDKFISEDLTDLLKNGGKIQYVPLPGHYFDMFGILYTDSAGHRVLFAGDGFFGRQFLFKYWIPYIFDVGKEFETLDKLSKFKADYYIPSHGDALTRIEETVEENQIALLSTEICIMGILNKESLTFEELLKRVADKNGINMKAAQIILIGSTLRAYLVYLRESGKADFYVEGNKMFWKSTGKN